MKINTIVSHNTSSLSVVLYGRTRNSMNLKLLSNAEARSIVKTLSQVSVLSVCPAMWLSHGIMTILDHGDPTILAVLQCRNMRPQMVLIVRPSERFDRTATSLF